MEPVQDFQYVLAGPGIQGAGRFVGHDDRRVGGNGAGDGHPLLLAAGHLGRLVAGAVRQAHLLQRFLRPFRAQGGRHPLIDQGQLHVFPGVEGGDQVKPLKDEADLLVAHVGQLPVGQLGHIHPIQMIVPVGGDIQAAEDVHQGGFAGAGRPDDGHELAPVDAQGDPVQGPHLALFPLVIDLEEVFYIYEHRVNPNCRPAGSHSR